MPAEQPAAEPVRASLLMAAKHLEAAAGGDREGRLKALRDAAVAIEGHLDLLASESRPGGAQVLQPRVLSGALTVQDRLRQLQVSAWGAERTVAAGQEPAPTLAEIATGMRKAAADVLTMLHDSMSYADVDQ